MHIPLYEKFRPQKLTDVAGQDHLVGENGYLTYLVKNNKPTSLLLFGPPGCGKTTIARLYAQALQLPFTAISGVFQSGTELKKILKEGQQTPLFHRQMLVFVDEIHRFNRAQQDIFLPFLEDGSIILIGATTENPSFVLNNALLSRLRVLHLHSLSDEALEQIISRFEAQTSLLPITAEARKWLIASSQGDGRYLLNCIETIHHLPQGPGNIEHLSQFLQRRSPLYDRDREGHYNLISALHKSIRGSDPDAALYWFCRMLNGGEDPLFIGRRLIRCASEDVGLADPQALGVVLAAFQSFQTLGSPEGDLALAQAVVYLALAPKSNAIYTAFGAAKESAEQTGHLDPPKIILNAPTAFMKQMGYSQGYVYDHDTPTGFSGQAYFPDALPHQAFYHPVERGFEREMRKRLDYFTKLRQNG